MAQATRPRHSLPLDPRRLLGMRCPGGPEREGENRAQRRATRPIRSPRGWRDKVADAIQTRHRLINAIEHMAVRTGLRAAFGIERAAGDQCRKVRPGRTKRPHSGIFDARLVLYRAIKHLFDDALATPEIGIFAFPRKLIKAFDFPV